MVIVLVMYSTVLYCGVLMLKEWRKRERKKGLTLDFLSVMARKKEFFILFFTGKTQTKKGSGHGVNSVLSDVPPPPCFFLLIKNVFSYPLFLLRQRNLGSYWRSRGNKNGWFSLFIYSRTKLLVGRHVTLFVTFRSFIFGPW